MSTLCLVPASRDTAKSVRGRAEDFVSRLPHRDVPYSKRNWGGRLHSLCSYQGKLKPAIAHFLVNEFTAPGETVLDPLAGVGTIPLEARRLGRQGIANDLSPVCDAISRAKLEPFDIADVAYVMERLRSALAVGPPLDKLVTSEEADFGLNGPISSYFHPETLREVLIARRFFAGETGIEQVARDVVLSSVLHILHGNRPYALSRQSHPVTPFAPTGPYLYRPLLGQLENRLDRVVPELIELSARSHPGESHRGDFRSLRLERKADAVITSPPFSESFRFWSMNWMRLWFAGWGRNEFDQNPPEYLETQQRGSFEVYADFSHAMHDLLKPQGLLIMHLGETTKTNMVDAIAPQIEQEFTVVFTGREDVRNTETHGLSDKGATKAHWYMFAIAR